MSIDQSQPKSGRLIIWGSAALFLALAGYFMLSDGGEDIGNGREARRPTVVEVEAVALRAFSDVIEAIGTAKANESVVLTARVSETVQRVNFSDGMMVEKGTILVELTNAEEVAQAEEARANVREAQQQFDRIAGLVAKGTVSQSAADERVRELSAARSRLAAAEARTADRIIRAPFSGILGLRNVSPGALVSPGMEITTLDDNSIIKLDFQVPERFLAVLAPDQSIIAEASAYSGRKFEGIVRTINSRVDPVTRAVTVRAEIANDERLLRAGMLLTVKLISDERMTLAVPEGAIVPVGEEKFVYVVGSDMTVRLVTVETGARAGGYIELLAGVEAGTNVVWSGTVRLRPGGRIEIKSTGRPATARPDAPANSPAATASDGGQQR